MTRVIQYLLVFSIILSVVSCLKRNKLPNEIILLPELIQEPSQAPTDAQPFSVNLEGERYDIAPQFDYELYGLVVSLKHHNGDMMLHKLWSDHLNMSDLCVVWGATAQSPLLNKIKFWNGQFTCNVKTRNQSAWDAFNMQQLSNNHLISEDLNIRAMLRDVNVGDQVVVRGWLASYKNSKANGGRGTSTTRTDTGNGACETIYVRSFQVLNKSQNMWRSLYYFALLLSIILVVLYLIVPIRKR